MRVPLALSLAALPLLSALPAGAQSIDEIVAYTALTISPPAAFAPLPPPTATARGSALVLRYGYHDVGDGTLHNFSLGGDIAVSGGRLGLTVGGTTCDGCDGNIMAGLDFTTPLTRDLLSVALRPAVGFSKPLDSDVDGTALSLSLALPIGMELSSATGPLFVPYLVPGVGFGRISGDRESHSGTRPMLGGGISIAGRQSALAAHVGVNKVFVSGGKTTLGVGVSFGRRTPPMP